MNHPNVSVPLGVLTAGERVLASREHATDWPSMTAA